MNASTGVQTGADGMAGARKAGLMNLVGSGDRIGRTALPFVLIGVALNVWRPEWFAVGGPPAWLAALSWAVLAVGVVVWLWSVALIVTKVPRHELITTGPFALAKHPLYAGVSLLVLPWAGFLLNTWMGLALGLVIYVASRRYAPAEEQALAEEFGSEWGEYARAVVFPWL